MQAAGIKEVSTSGDLKKFLKIPREIYRNRAEVVPDDVKRLKSILYNFLNNDNGLSELRLWFIPGFGRVAALMDHGTKLGWFGYFDVRFPGKEAASLLEVATQFMKNSGAKDMTGPVSFAERDRYWGMMKTGQDKHAWGENYHVKGLCEQMPALGFETAFEQYTYEVHPHGIDLSQMEMLASRVVERFKPESLTLENVSGELIRSKFMEVYNAAWPQSEPLTPERTQQLFREMRPVLLAPLVQILTIQGKSVSIFAAIAEPAQFTSWYPWLTTLRWILNKLGKSQRQIRGLVFGVVPEYQRKGLEAYMFLKIRDAVLKHYPNAIMELSWVGSFNPNMMKLVQRFGAKVVKTHVVWTRKFEL